MLDYLILNAKIVDGTGNPSYKGCVDIKDKLFFSLPDKIFELSNGVSVR